MSIVSREPAADPGRIGTDGWSHDAPAFAVAAPVLSWRNGVAMDVPGTYVFDGEQSRRGYPLNTMCFSLRSTENRERFAQDEESYCERFGLSEEQKGAVLERDWTRMLDLGGSIFYVLKLAMLDGRSMQYLGGRFSGMTEEEFARMMRAGGRTRG